MAKKVIVSKKETVEVQAQPVVAQQKAPNCSVNFVVVAKFNDVMAKYKLTKDSSVNNIVLALYKEFGSNLNPAATAKQIRDFKGADCKCSGACISWYKNHYDPVQHKIISKKKNANKKQELLDKLYKVEALKPIHHMLAAIPMTKLEEYATQLGV